MSNHFLRLPQIIGQQAVSPEQAAANRKRGKGPRTARPAITPILPISKSSFWAGVKDGRFPKPTKLGPRTTVWSAESIFELIDGAGV